MFNMIKIEVLLYLKTTFIILYIWKNATNKKKKDFTI